MNEEESPGGSRIFRYTEPESDEQELSVGDGDLIDAVDAHLAACFGSSERTVFHELVSPTIHLDVHVVPPNDEFPFQRLVTSGMAERPMTVPAGFGHSPYAELTIALPADWPTDQEAFDDERVYWPIRLLKSLGRLPHDHSTFLWYGHTIPNGDPPGQYAADTDLCCALVSPPIGAPVEFNELVVGDRTVRFLGVIPLYEDEMRLKLAKGTDALLDRFDDAGIGDLVVPCRANVALKRRRLFGR